MCGGWGWKGSHDRSSVLVLWSILEMMSGVTLRARLRLGMYSLLLLLVGSKGGRTLTSRSV